MGRTPIQEGNKLSNAERCRRYRSKHAEKYKKDDALRKRHERATAQLNSEKNSDRLFIQAMKKQIYRSKLKQRKAEAEATASSETNLTEKDGGNMSRDTTESDMPTSAFKHKSTKCRSLRKAQESLPKSPSKRTEVVKEIAKTYLRLDYKKKSGIFQFKLISFP